MLEKALSLDEGFGFNISTGDVADLISEGIIDPAKVTRCALQNAVSAIGTLITTSHAIIEE
jgi:chaperonin GroEL